MRAAALTPTLSLLVALGASLCACAHISRAQDTPTEESEMATEDQGTPAIAPKLDAETALSKVLELIRSSKGINDFTPDRISEVTGLRMNFDGPDRFGAGERLTPEWNYSFYVNRAGLGGPQFMFSFDPSIIGQSPPATAICGMDFNAFAKALEQMGFKKETWYAEHGRILKYTFDSSHMYVSVGTEGEDDAPPDRLAHQCIRTVTVK